MPLQVSVRLPRVDSGELRLFADTAEGHVSMVSAACVDCSLILRVWELMTAVPCCSSNGILFCTLLNSSLRS